MRRTQLLVWIALLWLAGTSPGQEALLSPIPAQPGIQTAPTVQVDPGATVDGSAASFWAEADYVLYWLKPVCFTVAGVSAGNPADPHPGVLGQPGTELLQGNHKYQFGGTNGLRSRVGAWLTSDQFLGVEAEGFVLEQAAAGQSVSSGSGSTPLFLVFQNPDNSQAALPFSVPGVVAAQSSSVGTSRLWGIDSNLLAHIAVDRGAWTLHATGLFGFRYLDLSDRVLVTNTQSLVSDPSMTAVGAANFSTRNQFYGGQVGSRLGLGWGPLRLDLTTKLALGETHLVSSVAGGPLLSGTSLLPGLVPGPLLALPSNVGRLASDRMTVVPEVNLRLRWQVAEHLYLTVGYNALYWNRILCPGDQMDSHVNTTQLPGNGPVIGAAVPAPKFVFTDAFLQGIETGFGVTF